MRRTVLVLVLLVAAVGVVAVGCGQEEDQTATPETVEGELTTETTETETTETTETDETETETDETETTDTETTTTPSAEGDPAAGKGLPRRVGVRWCHTLADAGSTGQVGPNLDESQPDYELALDRVTNGQGGMPSFSSTLSEQQIADVSAYVSSVAGS